MSHRPPFRIRVAVVKSLFVLGTFFAACGGEHRSPAEAPAVGATVEALAVIPQAKALLVVGSTTLVNGDTALKNRLATNLGYAVTVVAGSTTTSTDASGKAVVVISESVTDTQVTTKFKSVTVPVVVLEPAILDDMGMTGTSSG